jgi:hypothetical protein
LYSTHPHILEPRLLDFLEYLRNRRPSIHPGYEFVATVLQTANRPILAYLLDKQNTFVREFLRTVEATPDARFTAEQIRTMRQRLALAARAAALSTIRKTRARRARRARKSTRRAHKTRRERR